MTSLPLCVVTFALNNQTNISCNSFGRRSWVEHLWGMKKGSLKQVCCKRDIHSKGNVRVSKGDQVGTLLTNNVEKEKVLPNEKIEQEKETMVSDGIGITSFLRGRVFLITGATGFLAKALVEKILRSNPNVGKIYLLIKAKDAESALQRLKSEVLNTELFKSLKETYGKSFLKFFMSKVVPVAGNVCESSLGMEADIADQIAGEVDIIINSAGNTVFHERFDVSLETNTMGPHRVLAFAKRCNKLMVFLHVSTAYANGERQGIIKEKPLNKGDSMARERTGSENPGCSFPLVDVEAEVKMSLDAKEDSEESNVTQNMKEMGLKRAKSHGWQDTYVFTKAMGEMLIANEREDIPVVIIRPSIVESTYREPFPGWIQGIRMLDPALVLYGKGDVTGIPCDPKGVIDIVPADMVVNSTLAAMVKHAKMKDPGLSIYHIASSIANPLVYRDMFNYFLEYFVSSPYMDLKRKRPIKVQSMKYFCSINDFISHIEADAIQRSNSAPTKGMIKMLKHFAIIYEPYGFYGGRFDNSNTEKLLKELSQEEKMNFGFDVKSIDWKDYMCNVHIPGVMKNVLKRRGMK